MRTPPGDDGQTDWLPVEGENLRILNPLTPRREEAFEILGKCLSPTQESGSRTGLVIGYVQSGKTSSFTAVSALARDNDFQLIIVVAGVSTNLFNQSVNRVRTDLTQNRSDSGWVVYRSDELDDRQYQAINTVLREWSDPEADAEDKRTVLLCVMKQHVHLDKTLNLIRNLNLQGIKTLIIDDEADQASLNTKISRQEVTAIYMRLTTLRTLLPHVTYLQYTATPQAPLLIRLQDMLSPEFVYVLRAGDGYTGGQTFFRDRAVDLIQSITPQDLLNASASNPPESLIEALRTFFLGACAFLRTPRESRGDGNRAMMIHPSHLTRDHGSYRDFIDGAIRRWQEALASDENSSERMLLVESFTRTHAELRRTVGDELPPVEELLGQLRRAIDKTLVTEVNRSDRGAPNIRWDVQPFHIVVGGQMLDRGYTVQGLCVTYMPRSGARGNLDTIHQRARWFGYKERYLNYCRVWLTQDTHDSFTLLVDHENRMREDLRAMTGSLKDWKRRFITAPGLQLTRRAVIGLPTIRGNYADEWFQQSFPGLVGEIAQWNFNLVNRLIEEASRRGGFTVYSSSTRLTSVQRHAVCRAISLRWLLDEFLSEFVPYFNERDAARLLGIQLQIAEYLGSLGNSADNEFATIVLMSHHDGTWEPRQRSGKSKLHQGANPRTNYPGDREIRSRTGVTLQLFNMNTLEPNGQTAPAIAIFVPSEASVDWIAVP